MKMRAFGLIFSILFASLPAKVWVCGLNLCPMGLVVDSQSEQSGMPCHQVSEDKTQYASKNSNDVNNLDTIANQIVCQCFDVSLDSTFIIESRKQFTPDKNLHTIANTLAGVNTEPNSGSVSLYRPALLRDSIRFQITLQVFII